MLITRISLLTGKTHQKDIAVNPELLRAYEEGKGLIQDLFPDLPTDDREFMMTGITKEQWEDAFGGPLDVESDDETGSPHNEDWDSGDWQDYMAGPDFENGEPQ